MNRANLTAVITSLFALALPSLSSAAVSTGPAFTLGLLGSYSVLEFDGQGSTSNEYIPEGGLFFGFGNKMTAQSGLVYNAELTGQYSKEQNHTVKDGQVDLDIGGRIALSENNFVDILLGAGYKWNRLQPDTNKYDVDLTSRAPFAKATIGYNHKFSTSTVRLEAGVRQTIQGNSELEYHGVYSEKLDIKDSTNPFFEVSYLFNQAGSIPVIASLYYNRFVYDLEGEFAVTDSTKQTRNEYGAKLGIAF